MKLKEPPSEHLDHSGALEAILVLDDDPGVPIFGFAHAAVDTSAVIRQALL
jgi:hypothetical protein